MYGIDPAGQPLRSATEYDSIRTENRLGFRYQGKSTISTSLAEATLIPLGWR